MSRGGGGGGQRVRQVDAAAHVGTALEAACACGRVRRAAERGERVPFVGAQKSVRAERPRRALL